MNDGSGTDTPKERQGSGDTTVDGDATIPNLQDAEDQYQTVPQTITPDPALSPTVTGGPDVQPSGATSPRAKHGDTIALGSAPTLLSGVERDPAVVRSGNVVRASSRREELIGTTVAGRYEIKSRLGAGGMGTVYLAQQTAVDRRVVLKFLHPEFSSRADLEERFHREARAASKLNHPNTIVLHDFGQTEDGKLYMAMEYLEGRSLSDLIDSAGALSPLRAVGVTLQILTSLTEAHAKGVIHRDLKPDNILLVKRGGVVDFVKVLDFGIAKIREQSLEMSEGGGGVAPQDEEQDTKSWEELTRELEQAVVDAASGEELTASRQEEIARLTQHGEICGSPGYMAPEQIRGDSIDHRADLYAVGVILYQLLTGTNPFKGRSIPVMLLRTMDKQVKPLRQTRPDLSLPRALDDLILRCLSKDPAGRPGSAEEVAEQLRQISPALARQRKEQELAMLELVGIRPRWRRHLRWALPALGLGLAALVWFSARGGREEGTDLAPGQRVLVAASAPQVPSWVTAKAPAGQRSTIRGAGEREAARVEGRARILTQEADIPSRYDSSEKDQAAVKSELRQVAYHARGLDRTSLPALQTFWTKIGVGGAAGRVTYVYDVHVFLGQLSAQQQLQLRRHFAALRYDRYSFLLTEAVRKRQCQRALELSPKEQEAIGHLPRARHKSALNYLQYRLKKCTGSEQ